MLPAGFYLVLFSSIPEKIYFYSCWLHCQKVIYYQKERGKFSLKSPSSKPPKSLYVGMDLPSLKTNRFLLIVFYCARSYNFKIKFELLTQCHSHLGFYSMVVPCSCYFSEHLWTNTNHYHDLSEFSLEKI